MNRSDRGHLLLIAAALLLLLAVVAYLMNDAEFNSRWRAANARDRQALLAQAQRSIVELKALRDEGVRIIRDRAEDHDQCLAILDTLARIERRLEEIAPDGRGGRTTTTSSTGRR